MGLPKLARLRTQRDFDRVHKTGLKFHGAFIIARIELRAPAGPDAAGGKKPSRLGLRVARRHGSAVERNRIKRLLREAFRLSQADWEIPVDLILIPKTQAWGRMKLGDLRDDFQRLERQISRFRNA